MNPKQVLITVASFSALFSFCNIFSDRFTRQTSYQRRSWLEITSSRWSKCKKKKKIFDKNMTFPLFGLVLLHVRVFLWATWLSAHTLNFIRPFIHSWVHFELFGQQKGRENGTKRKQTEDQAKTWRASLSLDDSLFLF